MKTTHTLSSIEAAAHALEFSGKIPNVSFSRVKPALTTHQTLEVMLVYNGTSYCAYALGGKY